MKTNITKIIKSTTQNTNIKQFLNTISAAKHKYCTGFGINANTKIVNIASTTQK